MTLTGRGGSSVREGSDDRAKKQLGTGRRGKNKKKIVPASAARREKSVPADLPPNDNIRKHADEVYGDTEIPERKK